MDRKACTGMLAFVREANRLGFNATIRVPDDSRAVIELAHPAVIGFCGLLTVGGPFARAFGASGYALDIAARLRLITAQDVRDAESSGYPPNDTERRAAIALAVGA